MTIDREDFLKQASTFPRRRVDREVLGFAWEMLVEGKSADEARQFVWPDTTPAPDPVRPPGLQMWGNFLNLTPDRADWGFGYPSPTFDGRRPQHRNRLLSEGYTDLPLALYGRYPGLFAWWDYREDLITGAVLLRGLRESGLNPWVFVATDDVMNVSWTELQRSGEWCVRIALDAGCTHFVTGWETDQQNNPLANSGQRTLEWIAFLRSLLPREAYLAHHPGRHRTDTNEMLYSGWFEDKDWDRHDWCTRAKRAGLNGMLANMGAEMSVDRAVYLLCEEPQRRPGVVGALGFWQDFGLEGFYFEHMQCQPAVHAEAVARVCKDARCKGAM